MDDIKIEILKALLVLGGVDDAQVERIVEQGSIKPKDVHVPGILVSAVVVADQPEMHRMNYGVMYNAALAGFYDVWAARLREIAATQDIVVLCEGDPFFYGSFMHLYVRLKDLVQVDVIPGIPGMVGCWNASGQPITWGDDVLTVLMGTLPEEDLVRYMQASDALAIMKTGRNLPRVRRALEAAGRLGDAWLVERGTMPNQRLVRLQDVDAADCPYFAIVLVHGHGRRPVAGGEE